MIETIPIACALVGVALCWRSVRFEQSASLRERLRASVETQIDERVSKAVEVALDAHREQLGKLRQDIADERSRAAMRGR